MNGPQRISATAAFFQVEVALANFVPAMQQRILGELRDFAPVLLARERASVPIRKTPASRTDKWRRPGGLRSLLATEIDDEHLRLRSGLLTADTRSDGFYGYILDAGRGNRSTRSRPSTRRIAGMQQVGRAMLGRYSIRYSRAISPIAPNKYDITFGRTRAWAQAQIGPVLLRAYNWALIKTAWSNGL